MKVLVLGCNGMAGHVITRYLKEGSSVLEKVKALESEGIMIGEGFGICLKYVK